MSYNATWERFRKSRQGKATRKAIYARDNYKCVYCGVKVEAGYNATLDHVNPKCNGQAITQPTNLVTCCITCNSRKGKLSVFDFVELAALPYSTITRVNRQRHKPIS